MAADAPPEAIARLLTFCGLDAVLLVRPCGAAERVVSMRQLVGSFSAVARVEKRAPRLLRCRPGDPLLGVAGALFHGDHDGFVVEEDGKRLALITADHLADYLTRVTGAAE